MLTLKTLPMATEQEVFDHVARHLVTQGRRSEYLGSCLYRSDEGLKCAGGCLIADDGYSPEFEGVVWSSLVDRGLVPENCANLILSLQGVHDTVKPPEWPQALQALARRVRLNAQILEVCDVGS